MDVCGSEAACDRDDHSDAAHFGSYADSIAFDDTGRDQTRWVTTLVDVVRGATLGRVGGETVGALILDAARGAGEVADLDTVGHPVGHRVVSPASMGREPVMAKNMTQGSVVLLIQLWMVPRWIITSPS